MSQTDSNPNEHIDENIEEVEAEKAEGRSSQRLNDLDGATWLQWSKSIWRFKTPVVENFGHPAIFPDFVAERLIKIFTKEQNVVLDPMAGVGTTLFVAKTLYRNAVGIELSPKYYEIAKSRLNQQIFPKIKTKELIPSSVPTQSEKQNTNYHKIFCDDARNLLTHVSPSSIDFCLTSPPYWIGLHGVPTCNLYRVYTTCFFRKPVSMLNHPKPYVTPVRWLVGWLD